MVSPAKSGRPSGTWRPSTLSKWSQPRNSSARKITSSAGPTNVIRPSEPLSPECFTVWKGTDVVSERISFTYGMDKGSPAPRFEHETMKVGDTIDNNTSSLFTINKLEEQQLPIFRQRPQLVVYKHLEMIGAVTYLVHLFFYLCRI